MPARFRPTHARPSRARACHWVSRPAWVVWLLAVMLAGCVAKGSAAAGTTSTGGSAGGSDATSLLGGWVLQTDPACRESLGFLADGRFVHGVALSLQGQSAWGVAGGAWSGLTPDGSALAGNLAPDSAVIDPLLTYCAQWQHALRRDAAGDGHRSGRPDLAAGRPRHGRPCLAGHGCRCGGPLCAGAGLGWPAWHHPGQ